MEQFINWGPGQNNSGSRLEDEMREWAINKMIREAVQTNTSRGSNITGGVGGGSRAQIGDKTGIYVYWNDVANSYEYFIAYPEGLRFSNSTTIPLVDETSSIDTVYLIDRKGYVIVFNNADNTKTFVMVSGKGERRGRFTADSNIEYGVADDLVFYGISESDHTVWIFDGADFRVDEEVIGSPGFDSYNLGTSESNIAGQKALILKVSGTSEDNRVYRKWLAIDSKSSTELLTDYYEETGETTQLIAKYNCDYLIVDTTAVDNGESVRKGIIDLTGNIKWSEDFTGVLSLNYYFYGIENSILLQLISDDNYEFRFFDPSAADPIESYSHVRGDDDEYRIVVDTTSSGSSYENQPANTVAVAIFESVGDGIAGNMVNVGGVLMLTRFGGEPIRIINMPVDYANTYDFSISSDAVIIPVSKTGDDYQLYRITKTSADEEYVPSISLGYGNGDLSGVSFNRVANGFLLEIAYAVEEVTYVYMITNSGEFSTPALLTLPGIEHNVDDQTDWYDESGPLLYYVYPTSTIYAWLPDLGEWQSLGEGSMDFARYSTQGYADPTYKDGSNYLLARRLLRLYWFNDSGDGSDNEIDDGGDDMYDSANQLFASSQNYQIPYTHTQSTTQNENREVSNISDFIMDGVVESGADYGLGQASEYFTNLYPGLFVMSAASVDTDSFKIDGNIGADGNGLVDSGKIQLTQNGYWLYYKRVWDAGDDPSINQLIIVNAVDDTEIVQSIDESTDDDTHSLTGLDTAIVSQIHYLLFALADGARPSIQHLTDLANAWVSLYTSDEMTHTGFLTLLNQSYGTLLETLPPRNPVRDTVGKIVNRSEIIDFNINQTSLNSVYLGTNGFYIVSFSLTNLIKIDHYSLTGTLLSTIETDFNRVDESVYSDTRAILIVSKPVDGGREGAMFIFNSTGYARKEFNYSNYVQQLNDRVW